MLSYDFCRAMLCKRGFSRHAVSVSVCVCVRHASFSVPNGMAIVRRKSTPYYGALNARGVGRNMNFQPTSEHGVNAATASCYNTIVGRC